MISRKCQRFKSHQNNAITSLCLQPNCKFNRLLCQDCFNQHNPSHIKTILELNHPNCKLNNLNRLWLQQNSYEKLVQIERKMQSAFKKPKQIFNTIKQKIETCQRQVFTKSVEGIRLLFSQETCFKFINQILNSSITLQKIEHFSQIINLSNQPQTSNSKSLFKALETIQNIFQNSFQEIGNQLHSFIDKIIQICNHWSILENHVDWRSYIDSNTLIQKANSEKWSCIIEWISKGNKVNEMTELILRGNRGQPKISKTIEGNNLTHIQCLEQLQNLRSLSISKNTIKQAHNEIKNIQNIQNLRNLKILSLSNNYIVKIQNLEHQINLTELWLQNNNIKKIQNLSQLQKLQILDLSNNSIEKIQNLSKLTSLEQLLMQINQINIIENLSELQNLTSLKLCHNKIAKIQNLDNLSSLVRIDLSNNQIQIIQNLDYLKCLKQVQLQRNPLRGDTRNKLAIKNLQNNHIMVYTTN